MFDLCVEHWAKSFATGECNKIRSVKGHYHSRWSDCFIDPVVCKCFKEFRGHSSFLQSFELARRLSRRLAPTAHSENSAARTMKMATTASPWCYEAALKTAPRPANALIPSRRRGDYVDLACSGSKDEACPGVGAQELIWHLGHLVERFAGAVQWNDAVDIDVLERLDRVAHIVFLVGGEVESANSCLFPKS